MVGLDDLTGLSNLNDFMELFSMENNSIKWNYFP